jgi:hypothetical protein
MSHTRLFSRPVFRLLTPVVAAALVAAGAGAATAVTGQTSVTLYVSPTGSATMCVSTRPCTLTTAQSQARTAAHNGLNVTVLLAGGTYALASPLSLTTADSGLAGHRVSYQAAAGQTPIFSGGRTITGWTQYSVAANIWVASVPGIKPTRQLYVNGKRASVASAPVTSVLGTITPTSSGYETSQSPKLSAWTGTADQPDLMYPGVPLPWEQSLCGIAATSGTSVTMANPCFQNLTTPMANYTVPASALSTPAASVENNLALLTQPGQFYVSTHDGKVYYIPRAGERMSTSTVYAPQLTTLVTATWVSNLTISGVTFSYATWLPSATQGMVDVQSNLYDASSNADWAMIPSAVAFASARNVVFTGNTLTHLGGAGVSFDAGGSANTVSGNVVTDVSSSGISLSSPLGASESGDLVSDNYIHHVGVEYRGGVGIFAGMAAHATISHNEVWAIPGVGISLGWGWGAATPMTDNHVDYNRVHDVNQTSLSDGGAIYLNGAESGSALNSSVVGNYVSGDPQPFGALYVEAGASNYNVSGNVVSHTGTNWLYLQTQQYGSPAVNNVISGNFTDAGVTIDPSNSLTNNLTGLTSWPSAATSIMAAAGIEPAYASITHGTVDTDLSYGTTATASSTDASSPAATAANDGDSTTAWTSAAGAGVAVWQTDLGSARTLSEIQALTNQNSDLPTSRANLQVVVSNSPITATSTGTTVCTVASPGLAYQGIVDCPAPAGTWRYVGIVATGGNQLSIAEFRAFGH